MISSVNVPLSAVVLLLDDGVEWPLKRAKTLIKIWHDVNHFKIEARAFSKAN